VRSLVPTRRVGRCAILQRVVARGRLVGGFVALVAVAEAAGYQVKEGSKVGNRGTSLVGGDLRLGRVLLCLRTHFGPQPIKRECALGACQGRG
jgi:hypothetical protein